MISVKNVRLTSENGVRVCCGTKAEASSTPGRRVHVLVWEDGFGTDDGVERLSLGSWLYRLEWL